MICCLLQLKCLKRHFQAAGWPGDWVYALFRSGSVIRHWEKPAQFYWCQSRFLDSFVCALGWLMGVCLCDSPGRCGEVSVKKRLWLQVSLGGILGQGCVTAIRENWKEESDRKEQWDKTSGQREETVYREIQRRGSKTSTRADSIKDKNVKLEFAVQYLPQLEPFHLTVEKRLKLLGINVMWSLEHSVFFFFFLIGWLFYFKVTHRVTNWKCKDCVSLN